MVYNQLRLKSYPNVTTLLLICSIYLQAKFNFFIKACFTARRVSVVYCWRGSNID
jgi:hypothetical protein